MNKRISMGLAIAMSLIIATVTFTLTMMFSMIHFNTLMKNVLERENRLSKLTEVSNKIEQNALYGENLDQQTVSDNLIRGYLAGTGDAYAQYYTAEEYKALLENNKGEVVGFGVDITKDPSGYVKITDVYEDSPAKKQDLRIGDLIKTVDGKDVLKEGYTKAVRLLQGEANTKVKITLLRGENTKRKQIDKTITRKNLTIQTVIGQKVGDVGYVRIKSFNAKTPAQFEAKVEELKSLGVKSFVFDVRGNGGGLLDSVNEVLDYLLPEGVIAYSVDKENNKEVLKNSDKSALNMPMTVLVNGGTASAAELFASAIRDFKVGNIVGTTTYGKGVIQETIQLSDGSAIRFTTKKYLPPSEVSYDGIGIKPEFEVILKAEQEEKLYTTDISEDPQFKKAVEVLGTKGTN